MMRISKPWDRTVSTPHLECYVGLSIPRTTVVVTVSREPYLGTSPTGSHAPPRKDKEDKNALCRN